MNQIIRVEHADGVGMFRDTDLTKKYRPHAINENFLCKLYVRHDGFKTLFDDYYLIRSTYDNMYEHFCAYKSIEHIQEWILKDEFIELANNGYKVYLLEVSTCLVGVHNIMYKKEDIISKQDITSLFIN